MSNTTSTAMVSRSLRLKKDTLEVLQEEANKYDMGITVYIRYLLEKHVSTGTVGIDE